MMIDNLDRTPLARESSRQNVGSSQPVSFAARIIVIQVRKILGKRQKLDDVRIAAYMSRLDDDHQNRVIEHVEKEFLGIVSWDKDEHCFVRT